LDAGHQVVVVDDLSTGSVANLETALERYGFLLRVVDLLDAEALSDCFTGVDWVFHLAGRNDVQEAGRRPGRALELHLQGTLQILECARHFGVKRFVHAASASTYGNEPPLPTAERVRSAPADPLAVTRALAEQLVLDWSRLHGLPALSLRLFHVYGSRAPLLPGCGSVVSVFLAQRAAGAPLTVAGDGLQTRDFVHVDDATRALLRAAESEVRGQAINIGSGCATPIGELARCVGGPTVAVPPRPGDVRHRQADIRRASARLGWRPEIDLDTGIRGLLAQLDEWSEAPVWTEESVAELYGAAPVARPGAGASAGHPTLPIHPSFPIL
jgi:UDP-glucose 4-epimerase